MSQSTLIAMCVFGAFVIYSAMVGSLPKYLGFLGI